MGCITSHHRDTLRLTKCRLLLCRIYRLTLAHLRTYWFEIIIEFIIKSSFSPLLRLTTHSSSHHLTVHLLIKIFPCLLQLGPVVVGLFQMLDSVLKLSLFFHDLLNFNHWIFACIIFEYSKSLSQIFIFLRKLENLSISIIERLRLSLNFFS